MVRFYTGTLFSFDFALNFLETLLATLYAAFSPCLVCPGELKNVHAFPKNVRFDPGSSIKLL